MKIVRAHPRVHARFAQWQTAPGRAGRLPACSDRYRTDRARHIFQRLRQMSAESGELLAVCARLPQVDPDDLAHAERAARTLARELGHALGRPGRYHWQAQEGLSARPWHIHATYPMPAALEACPQCGGPLTDVTTITRQGEIVDGWKCGPCNLHAQCVTDLLGHARYLGGPYQALAHLDPLRAADLALRDRDRLGRPARLSGTGRVNDLGWMLFTECRGSLLLLGLYLLTLAARDRCAGDWAALRGRAHRKPVDVPRHRIRPPIRRNLPKAAHRPAVSAGRPRAGPGMREGRRNRARRPSLSLSLAPPRTNE